ncbi:hypothetical protein J1N35_008918 [Gossypium stocksii]|uniref:RNase H type-1 domain-containing protein n=1 Tax=Gossypium stocksii TaxID=47602 RepID=A0A9D3WBQ5_9ROSI|nr:hypothetical protein J1N35_008918 [Gossypium stocksii]
MVTCRALAGASAYFALSPEIKVRYPPSIVPVPWQGPTLEWQKLNTNGSSQGNPGKAGVGAIIRDHKGNWAKRCSRHIPKANSVEAELCALRDGLKLAVNLNITHLEIEVDATSIISLIPNTIVS